MDADSVVACCKREQYEVAKTLLTAGANVHETYGNNQLTAMHYAAMHGNLDMCKFILARQGSVHASAKDGTTPLHLAVAHRHRAVALFLVSAGAHVAAHDKKDRPPFLQAPWHELVFPCLVSPLHATIIASIEKSALLQKVNVAASQSLQTLSRRLEAQAHANFEARTQLYDMRKFRHRSKEVCATLAAEIASTRESIRLSQTAIAALETQATERAALLVETEAAILDQADEHTRVLAAIDRIKDEITEVEAKITVITTRSQEKYEAIKSIALFPQSERLMEQSCRAIVRLAPCDENRHKLLVNGLLPTWLHILERHAHNVAIQAHGVTLLLLLLEKTGSLPIEQLARCIECIAHALGTLRSYTAVDYAQAIHLDSLQRLLTFASASDVAAHSLRSIEDSMQLLRKRNLPPLLPDDERCQPSSSTCS
ncbi:hypothetical protein SDRG_05191 [Saprolegnia diclina VS20]|uniref:Uncharacterized protein n=1 Tax=Saprolegnia diclina (strain VS20) TaxID=1156394 RepID=T0QUB3_SAPDV|nr:hypothetical protein SDRG_05191 [Saprolegnia diclina VS20]EQC37595.1 hypothetical protein SDRG_05191 [Saprolegnia diclina VS20]|eukprot:XP_008609115.1 hypothetical protein SDRG_05191 [Saprolegnia diclina VS20]